MVGYNLSTLDISNGQDSIKAEQNYREFSRAVDQAYHDLRLQAFTDILTVKQNQQGHPINEAWSYKDMCSEIRRMYAYKTRRLPRLLLINQEGKTWMNSFRKKDTRNPRVRS